MAAGVRKRWRLAAGVVLSGLCLLACILVAAYLALQRAPAFYEAAVATARADHEAAGKQFERNVLALHNDLQQSGHWTRVFTSQQINGWLAVDLPEKFPRLLPPTIHDPRVELTPGRMQVAFRFESPRLSAVVSLLLEVHLADEPNTLSVRIRNAQAGWIPIPLKDFLDQLSDAARQAELKLRWAQQDGDPVALITILPDEGDAGLTAFTLTGIEIRDGELALSGQTDSATDTLSADAEDRTPPQE